MIKHTINEYGFINTPNPKIGHEIATGEFSFETTLARLVRMFGSNFGSKVLTLDTDKIVIFNSHPFFMGEEGFDGFFNHTRETHDGYVHTFVDSVSNEDVAGVESGYGFGLLLHLVTTYVIAYPNIRGEDVEREYQEHLVYHRV